MPIAAKYTPDEVVELGRAIYERAVRKQVEDYVGQYLMINIETGVWTLGVDHLETALRARQEAGTAAIYGMRIGYPAAESMNGGMRPMTESETE